MLHITNGESVSIPQTSTSRSTHILEQRLPLQELSRIRARFNAEFFGMPLSEVSFVERDDAIVHLHNHEEVISLVRARSLRPASTDPDSGLVLASGSRPHAAILHLRE
jgi:DNA-binding LytR/AlgR family response regulator